MINHSQTNVGYDVNKEKISIPEANLLARELLENLGLPKRDAEITSNHLISAELRGYPGHGLRRIVGIASTLENIGKADRNTIVTVKPGFVLIDGQRRLGIPSIEDALNEVADRLNSNAAIVFGVKGYFGTTGSLGIYGSRLARRGFVPILMCNSDFAVAPYGSKRAVLGTNPIAVAFPGSPTSFCADVATAAWSYGAIKDAANAGKSIPIGVVQSADGGPSTDPNDADNGSQLPMAAHKGYALGLAVELLCGPLIGAKAGRNAVLGTDGFFGVIIRADAARSIEESNTDAQALFSEILAGPPIDPDTPIRIPGDTSSATEQSAQYIELPKGLLKTLRKLRS